MSVAPVTPSNFYGIGANGQLNSESLFRIELEYFSLLRKKTNNDQIFFRQYPEWFGYMVVGRKLLTKMSKSRQFQRFTSFQVDFMLSFNNPKIQKMFVIANRGGAKTWILAYCCVHSAATHDNYEISLLGGSREQSNKPYAYAKRIANDENSGCRDLIVRATNDELEFTNGSIVHAMAASSTSTRGPRGDVIVVDEITQVPEDILTGFFGQAITSAEFKLVCGGTPDDPGHMSYGWWCSPPTPQCHHWVNADVNFDLFHWDAFDCLISNGGWIYPDTLEAMKSLYKSHLDYRREILGLWTSKKGSILKLEDINKACENFNLKDLPDEHELDGVIIAVDGARHSHYSTIVVIGYVGGVAYIMNCGGWQEIAEQELRGKIMRAARHYHGIGLPTWVIIEDAPISKTLIDNARSSCMEEHIHFRTSAFAREKNRFVDNVAEFFETGAIRIPQQYLSLINELFMWRWADNGKPEKGNDDFVDALSHGLMYSKYLTYQERDKEHVGVKQNFSPIVTFFSADRNRGHYGYGNDNKDFGRY